MATLSKRLVVKIPDDLDTWINQQAEEQGMDAQNWVRSLLTRTMKGLLPRPRIDLEQGMTDVDGSSIPPCDIKYQPLGRLAARLEGIGQRAIDAGGVLPTSEEIIAAGRSDERLENDLLAARAAEAAESAKPPLFVEAPPAEEDLSHERVGAAVPLHRIERSRYNPGRSGYG